MGIMEYRAKAQYDNQISDAVTRAVAPGLLDLIESGQRLNDPRSNDYRSMGDIEVFNLVKLISHYRRLMRQDDNDTEYDRSNAALACGHGYTLMDTCPCCDNHEPPTPGELPLIALVPVPADD